MLSYSMKVDLAEPGQQERETLTCEQCGVKVRGARGLKIHLQLCASREMAVVVLWAGILRSIELRCPRARGVPRQARNQQTQAQASSIPESIVNNPQLPVLQSASTSAPADDSASAATSSQRWQSRNRLVRHTSLNVRGSHADAQGDNKRLRQSNLRDLWRGQPSRRSGGI